MWIINASGAERGVAQVCSHAELYEAIRQVTGICNSSAPQACIGDLHGDQSDRGMEDSAPMQRGPDAQPLVRGRVKPPKIGACVWGFHPSEILEFMQFNRLNKG
jgi:hypothetical protein